MEKSRNRAYTICIDGKKSLAGFGQNLREVDYGHNPTLKHKQNQISVDEMLIKDIKSVIDNHKDMGTVKAVNL